MCGGPVGDVGGGGDRPGLAGRVDAEQVGASAPHDRVLAGGCGPGEFGEQLRAEREPGTFGGDPPDPAGDGRAGDEIGSAGTRIDRPTGHRPTAFVAEDSSVGAAHLVWSGGMGWLPGCGRHPARTGSSADEVGAEFAV